MKILCKIGHIFDVTFVVLVLKLSDLYYVVSLGCVIEKQRSNSPKTRRELYSIWTVVTLE